MMIRARFMLALVLAYLAAPAMALAGCRQALVLALDVSGSVDAREYRLQIDGVATALDNDKVRRALLSDTQNPVHLMVFEWSGPTAQNILIPWMVLDSDASIDVVTETLRQVRRAPASSGTAIGATMQSGAAFLAQQSDCTKHTLDISGDGISNIGPRPRDIRTELAKTQRANGQPITVNGLTIVTQPPQNPAQEDPGSLTAYYRAEVITGPGAFVMDAHGFDDYARAMTEKLIREIDNVMVSQLMIDQ